MNGLLSKIKDKASKRLILLVTISLALAASVSIAVALTEGQVTSISMSPDPIRLGSTAYLNYNLGQDTYVTIKVYKDTGEQVRTLLDNRFKYAGSNYQSWDGKDANGVIVDDGYYKFTVEAKDSAGSRVGYADLTVLAAKVPTISNVTDSPDPLDPIAGQPNQSTINYTLSSNAKVTITIEKNYSVVRTLTSQELKSGGTYSIVWDGKNDNGTLVGDGIYDYKIYAESPTVSSFYSTYKSNITVEKEPPSFSDFTAYPIPFKISSSTMSIRFTLSEDAKVTAKILDNAGQTVRTILSGVAKRAGYNSCSWDGKNDSGVYIPEGDYTVLVNAVDNFNKASGDYTIAFKAGYHPAISGAAISPNPFDPTSTVSNQAYISYNITHNALVTVKIISGYNTVRTITDKVYQNAGDQQVIWDGKDDNGTIVGDGSYYYQITAVSPTVESFSSTFKDTVTVESGNPEVTDLTLSPNPYKLGTTGTLSIRYNLSEASTVNVKVYKGSTLIRSILTEKSQVAGYNSTYWDGKDENLQWVSEGIYTVVVLAKDPSGLRGEAKGDVTAAYWPTISNVSHSPEPFDSLTTTAAVYFDISYDAKVTVTITQSSMPVRTISAGVLKAGSNYVNWDGKNDTGSYVADGPYTYQIEAVSPTVDTFRSTEKGSITVEANDPKLTDLYVSPYIVKIGDPATFRYTLSEPATVTAQIVDSTGNVVRDFPVETKTKGGYYSISWDTKDNSDTLINTGDYVLKLSAVDNFNKTGASQLAFQAGKTPVISNVFASPETVDTATYTSTNIYFDISENSYVTIKVLDSNGKIIRTLCSYKTFAPGSNSIAWDLKDAYGNTVNGTFTYTIDAMSIIGSFRAQQVTGAVSVTGTGPAAESCMDCHTSYPSTHPVTNCYGCHGNDEPIQDCSVCHPTWSHGSEVLVSYDCEFCHNTTYSYKVPGHGDINVIHTSPSITVDCEKCHYSNLTTEHPRYTDPVTLAPYDCNTCHSDTARQTVQDAVYNKDTKCSACHVGSGHEEYHAPTGIQADCTKCHIDSLTQEHLSNSTTQTGNTWTCDTCHSSTATQIVQDAVYNNHRQCSACHTQASHTEVHNTTSLDVNCTTASGCHNNNLTEEHLNNSATQTDPATGQLKGWDCDTCHSSSNSTVTSAVYAGNENCMACHSSGHNVNFVQPVPADLPKYPGFIWTAPQDTSLWAGESWINGYETNGKVIISNRRSATNGVVDSVYGPVYDYYYNNMTADGWTLVSPVPTRSDYFSATFTKNTRQATVWFYGGADHSADSAALSAGYRIELLYK